jgi:hypothetical protein
VRPWQVAGCGWMSVKGVFFAYPGGVPACFGRSACLRTVSVAVRTIRRPGAIVHGHMPDSVGAANGILQHLRRSEAM